MLMDLKTQELMHGFESLSVGRMDDNLPSAIGLGILVRHEGLQTLHVRNTGRNFSVCQDRRGKVSVCKFFGYALEMPAYLFSAGYIGRILHFNLDDTTGLGELEVMVGLGLAETHRHPVLV